jgi:hypothetical protein
MWHLIYLLINFGCVEQSAKPVAVTNGSSVNQSLSSQPRELPFSKSTIALLPPSLLPDPEYDVVAEYDSELA